MTIDLLGRPQVCQNWLIMPCAVELGVVGGGGEEGARQPFQRGLLGECGVRGGGGGSFQEISPASW